MGNNCKSIIPVRSDPGSEESRKSPSWSSLHWRDHIKVGVKYGATMTVPGMLFGAVRGIVKTGSPKVSALFSGLTWFILGSHYTVTRQAMIEKWNGDEMKTSGKVAVSAGAGAIAGAAHGLISYGLIGLIPGTFLYSIYGAGGQIAYNYLRDVSIIPERGWGSLKPFKKISSDEYCKRLEEKLLMMEAEISIIDDKVEAARKRIQERKFQEENVHR